MIKVESSEGSTGDSSLPLIEIVSHCYAVVLSHYAALLVYQASSLVLHKPRSCRVRLTVCVWGEGEKRETSDPNLLRVIEWMRKTLSDNGVLWKVYYMPLEQIGRRSIGRNRAALDSDADFIWFTDVDYVFGLGALDGVASLNWPPGATMIYPREVMISKDHASGDELILAVDLDRPSLVDLVYGDFVPFRYNRAIGGAQIVRGDFAREHGYLAGEQKWQAPTCKPFSDFRDDIAYRRHCERYGVITGVSLPAVFRIRHSKTSYQ